MIKNQTEFKSNLMRNSLNSNSPINNPIKPQAKSVSQVNQMNSNLKFYLYSLISKAINKEDLGIKQSIKKEAKPLIPTGNKTLFETFILSSIDKAADFKEKKEVRALSFKQNKINSLMKDIQNSTMNNTETGILSNKMNTNQSNDVLISESLSKKLASIKPIESFKNDNDNESFKRIINTTNTNKEEEDEEVEEEGDVEVDRDNNVNNSETSLNKIIDLNKTKRKEFSSICNKFKSSIIFNGQNLNRFNEKLKIAETKYFAQNDTLDLEEINKKRADKLFRHFEKKEHVYDSMSESEEDEMINDFFINPHSIFIFYFDMLIALCSLYLFISVPLDLAFNLHEDLPLTNWKMIMNTIISAMFIIDLILSFFVGYFTFEEEQLMTDVYDISINYLKSWFILDFLSGTPFALILKLQYPTHKEYLFTSSTPMLLQLLQIFRMFKMIKISFRNTFMTAIYALCIENQHLNKWFRVYLSVIFYFFCNHLLCCVFIFLAKMDYPNWIVSKNMEYSNQTEVYVASLYFIFTTIYTIGYGDICSHNNYERIFNIILLIVGIMAYSYALSALSNFVMEEDNCTAQFHKKLAILEEISHSNRLFSDSLFRKIYLHLKYKLKNEQNSSNEIIGDLPFGLRNTLIYEMYRPIIENFIFFKSFNNIEFIIKVILAMKPAMVSKNDKLVKEGDFVEEIYFVKRGNLVIEIPLPSTSTIKNKGNMNILGSTVTQTFFMGRNKTSKKTLLPAITNELPPVPYIKLLEIRRNEHFGDVLMFSNKKSPLSLKVKSKIAELFLLGKTDAVEISMQFPNIWRTIIKKSLYNMEQIEKLLHKSIHNFLLKNMSNNEADLYGQYSSTQLMEYRGTQQRNKTIAEEDSKYERSSIMNKQSQLSQIEESNKSDDEEEGKSLFYTATKMRNTINNNKKQTIVNERISNSNRSVYSICSENLSLRTKDLHFVDINEILPTLVSTNGANLSETNNSKNKITNEKNDTKSKENSELIEASFISNTVPYIDTFKFESTSFTIKPTIAYYPTNHPAVFIKGSNLSITDLDMITQQFISNQKKNQEKLQCKSEHQLSERGKSRIESPKFKKKHITCQITKQNRLYSEDEIENEDEDEGEGEKEQDKGDYLSKLDFNIYQSSQNLHNPESFYSKYFHSVLKNKQSMETMTELDKKVDDFFELIKTKPLKKPT